jgi:hypothetical protein
MATATAPKEETATPDPNDYTNYGDCALKLPPDWSRSRMASGVEFTLTTVGHENGRADAFLTMNPGQAHQFTWVAPEDKNRMSVLRTRHYKLVTKSEWTKNEHLWEWDGEGHIVHNGQLMMARERMYFEADEAEQERAQKERDGKRTDSPEEERLIRQLEGRGAILEDERGRPLKPLSPR